MKIVIINGPNLNLLGTREPEVYGSLKFEDVLSDLRECYPQVEIQYFQSNIEGEIVNFLQEAGFNTGGIILNAAGYSHTSVAIADAVKAIPAPVVEVHISNVFSREQYRHHSYITPHCVGLICGLGTDGYRLAVEFLLKRFNPN
ncbi:MAG TPA: type II 3-dehydroquinate dehydratase [Bacteroidales bacterium]|nr:type II 3-dehydroquinate dehydratase [Bacteroidales bacterium]